MPYVYGPGPGGGSQETLIVELSTVSTSGFTGASNVALAEKRKKRKIEVITQGLESQISERIHGNINI